MKKVIVYFIILLVCPLDVWADTGKSTIVMDVDSGRIIYRNNIYAKRLIASTTKIMTCLIVLENFDIDKEIEVGEEVIDVYGTNIYLEVGEKMKVKDLLYGLMLRSGNDAAIVLAKHTLGEDDFINKMNAKSAEIGMKDTSFENPHGLDDNTTNYSTAYDMALLASYAYKNEMYRKIVSTKKHIAKSSKKSYVWYNRMSLLSKYKNCVGGKNGYTPKAGKTLVSYAKKNNLLLTMVSLDDSEIYTNHQNLYDSCFKKYKNYLIIDKNNFKLDHFINSKESCYIKNSFSYPLTSKEANNITTLISINSYSNSNNCGSVIIKIGAKSMGKIKIYKEKSKKKKDKNIFHKIKKLFT